MKSNFLLPKLEIVNFQAEENITVSLSFFAEGDINDVKVITHDDIMTMFNV